MSCCSAGNEKKPCCQVESVITVDERGQMVLPKEIRERAGIQPGDKLALVSWDEESGIAVIALIRVDKLNSMVKQVLGPVFNELK
jgi:antitoxin PrlF